MIIQHKINSDILLCTPCPLSPCGYYALHSPMSMNVKSNLIYVSMLAKFTCTGRWAWAMGMRIV